MVLGQVCSDHGWAEHHAPVPVHDPIMRMSNGFNDHVLLRIPDVGAGDGSSDQAG